MLFINDNLSLIPFKPFRVCLAKRRLDLIGISILVGMFHCCYRDGTDGGRDTRSFSDLYFLLRYLVCLTLVSDIPPNILLTDDSKFPFYCVCCVNSSCQTKQEDIHKIVEYSSVIASCFSHSTFITEQYTLR